MAGSTAAEAVQNYVDPLRIALSCVTKEVLQVGGGYHPSDKPHVLTLARGNPVRLKGDSRISLSATQRYRVIQDPRARGPWRVSTVAYYYALEEYGEKEIIACHWHPFSGIDFAHLHLRAGAGEIRDELQKAHLPTGRIALEQLIRLAITDFRVEPLRSAWEDVLRESQEAFEAHRSWS